MEAYWDTSALLPLVLAEKDSPRAARAWEATARCVAWNWLRVEAEAALVRRQAPREAWKRMDELFSFMEWLEISSSGYDEICAFNRKASLRSADAGHLHAFATARKALPGITLVTFDDEMKRAALRLRLPVWEG